MIDLTRLTDSIMLIDSSCLVDSIHLNDSICLINLIRLIKWILLIDSIRLISDRNKNLAYCEPGVVAVLWRAILQMEMKQTAINLMKPSAKY